jgi:hypothetical protein
MVERVAGCRHMRCICLFEFCYACGSTWDKQRRRCGAKPVPCALYDHAPIAAGAGPPRVAFAPEVPVQIPPVQQRGWPPPHENPRPLPIGVRQAPPAASRRQTNLERERERERRRLDAERREEARRWEEQQMAQRAILRRRDAFLYQMRDGEVEALRYWGR